MKQIETVKTGKEKQEAYAHSFDTLNKAFQYHFYLEAVAITYAIMEDRLVAFLHHAGIVTRDKGDLKINRRFLPHMRLLLGKNPEQVINIKSISVKLSIVSACLELTEEKARSIDDAIARQLQAKSLRVKASPDYMLRLFTQINTRLDRQAVDALLAQIEPWRVQRNQLIHALMSKTVSASEASKQECAEAGRILARALDNELVKKFKKGNTLRKAYNIQ